MPSPRPPRTLFQVVPVVESVPGMRLPVSIWCGTLQIMAGYLLVLFVVFLISVAFWACPFLACPVFLSLPMTGFSHSRFPVAGPIVRASPGRSSSSSSSLHVMGGGGGGGGLFFRLSLWIYILSRKSQKGKVVVGEALSIRTLIHAKTQR